MLPLRIAALDLSRRQPTIKSYAAQRSRKRERRNVCSSVVITRSVMTGIRRLRLSEGLRGTFLRSPTLSRKRRIPVITLRVMDIHHAERDDYTELCFPWETFHGSLQALSCPAGPTSPGTGSDPSASRRQHGSPAFLCRTGSPAGIRTCGLRGDRLGNLPGPPARSGAYPATRRLRSLERLSHSGRGPLGRAAAFGQTRRRRGSGPRGPVAGVLCLGRVRRRGQRLSEPGAPEMGPRAR